MTTQNRVGIQRLPLELFSDDILLSCLPDDTFRKPQRDQAPFSVSQVCQSWRTAALSTPGLWSSIHIDWNGVTGRLDVPAVIIPLMELWFSRSLNYPLAISIELDLEDYVLEFLSRHLPRTQHFHISMVSRFGLEDGTIFKSTPLLTNLIMELFSDSEALNVVAQCPYLKYLELGIMGPPTRPTQHIILPELSTLVVTSRGLDPLFDSLTLPKLSILECIITSSYNDWPHLSFKKLYERSQFSLTTLKLRYFDIGEPGLKNLLTDFGSDLTELTIRDSPTRISDYVLDHLRFNPLTPTICPKLNTISLFNCVALNCSDGALAAMVHSRLMNEDEVEADPKFREAGLARLQTIRVSDDIEFEELLNLRERGVVVEVYSADSGNRDLLDL